MKIYEKNDPGFEPLWDGLLRNYDNPTALISQAHFDYRVQYLGPSLAKRVCAVVGEGNKPIVGCYFELTGNSQTGWTLDATATASAMIVARDSPAPVRAGAEVLLRKWIAEVAQTSEARRLTFLDQNVDGLAPLTHWALDHGASIECEFNQIVDLRQDEAALWRGLTKSCQWGVNWGRKHMIVRARHDPQALHELRRLHLEAAGFVTRSASTWELQGKTVESDEAFIVTADLDGRTVSAALFQRSKSDCYYGVSASDRNLFDKPLSHSIIWEAMKYARERGCLRFSLGSQVWERYRWHLQAPTRKQVNISKFKRSFGGETRPEFVVTLPLTSVQPAQVPLQVRPEIILREVVPEALKDPAWSRGEQVFLRPLTPDDVTERYLSWFSDPEVHRYLEVRAVSPAEARAYIEEGLTKNTYFMCAVCDLETGVHVGNLKIGPIRWDHRITDMVTVIGDKSYWGRQFATDAIRLASRLAFRVLGLMKLHASMYADNVGSLRAYTRAGWHVEARLRQHGLFKQQPQDTILISYFNSGDD